MRRRPSLLLATLAVVAAACAGAAGSGEGALPSPSAPATNTTPPATTTTPPATSTPSDDGSADPAAVPEALDFVAPAVDGGEVRGAAYAGGDVVLWMWAPW